MRKVVITGADGFVGSHTVQHFLNEGVTVLALDINENPKALQSHANMTYEQCDVFNIESLASKIKCNEYDTFIHFAWIGSAGSARFDYNLQMKNAINTVECMKVAQKLGVKRFVCAGSIMEYEVEAAIHSQGSKPTMGYIYGMGKHIAHCMCKAVAAEIGIDIIWPMITNAYGVGELSPRFINTTLRKILNDESLQFTSAIQNYDFVYISDVAKAFYLISKNGKPFHEYIIGSSNARPLKEFILEMQQAVAPDATLIFGDVPFTGTNMELSTFDTSMTEEDCGFTAEIGFTQGIRMTLEWLKTQ